MVLYPILIEYEPDLQQRTRDWCPKLTGIVIATSYFILISFVHVSPYIWMSLPFIVILCLTTFACRRETPILRFGYAGRNQTTTNEENEEDPRTPPIWMTDIPPSYSYIMENAPGTPPPSYGSAILMVPGVSDGKKEKEPVPVSSPMLKQLLDRRMFRSVSRQVSMENARRQMSRQISEMTLNDDSSGIFFTATPGQQVQRQISSSPQSQHQTQNCTGHTELGENVEKDNSASQLEQPVISQSNRQTNLNLSTEQLEIPSEMSASPESQSLSQEISKANQLEIPLDLQTQTSVISQPKDNFAPPQIDIEQSLSSTCQNDTQIQIEVTDLSNQNNCESDRSPPKTI